MDNAVPGVPTRNRARATTVATAQELQIYARVQLSL